MTLPSHVVSNDSQACRETDSRQKNLQEKLTGVFSTGEQIMYESKLCVSIL